MDYLKHLSASGQLRCLLEKETLHYISNSSFLKNKTKKKNFFLIIIIIIIIIIIYLQNAPEISFHFK